jgi:urease alpha subunit
MFVSQASIDEGIVQTYGLRKRIEAVKGCRTVGKKDMKFNDTMPKMKVDPESYVSFSTGSIFITTLIYARPSKQTACCATPSLPASYH